MKIKLNINKILELSLELIMKNINKNSLIIFGYSEMLTLALVVNSKLDKVKEFNITEDDNEDKFFKVVSNFISNKECFNNVFYSCGPGGFTIIRRIISIQSTTSQISINMSPMSSQIIISSSTQTTFCSCCCSII